MMYLVHTRIKPMFTKLIDRLHSRFGTQQIPCDTALTALSDIYLAYSGPDGPNRSTWRDKTHAPGHAHRVPGIWDPDNGAKAGLSCSWCRAWTQGQAVLEELSGY